MLTKLAGYKTYAVCGLSIIYALSALATGHMDANSAMEMVLAALGGMSMRHAVSNKQ